jgi:hypothetical protein
MTHSHLCEHELLTRESDTQHGPRYTEAETIKAIIDVLFRQY